MDKILKLIKEKRLRRGISQAVMGRRLRMVSSAYGKIERGQTELTVKKLVAICEILEFNTIEFTQLFIEAKQNPFSINLPAESILTASQELDLSKKINYLFKTFVNSLVEEKYRLIMEGYSYTEFTAEEWWDSLGDDKEEKLGMTEKEFWDLFDGSFEMIFNPEDEYEGFKKLLSSSEYFYFFKFGLIEGEQLCSLFQKFLKKEDIKRYPLKLKIPSAAVSVYLQSLIHLDIYESQQRIPLNQK